MSDNLTDSQDQLRRAAMTGQPVTASVNAEDAVLLPPGDYVVEEFEAKTADPGGTPAGMVFIVTEGCYSDYGIVGVFSTREKAEEFVRLFPGDNASVEEWEIDPYEREVREGIGTYRIEMQTDGNVRYCVGPYLPHDHEIPFRYREALSRDDYFMGDIRAYDKEHAIKIANERRIMLLAQLGVVRS